MSAPRPRHDLAALHQQVLVGQLGRKVVELLDQQDGQALSCARCLMTFADVLDDVGWMPSVGSSSSSSLGPRGQRPANGQLLLLAAREVAPRRCICLSTGRAQRFQPATAWAWRALLARPICRFSITGERPKISRPCGT